MNRIVLIIISLVFFCVRPAICQLNWAPVGAIWYYDAFEGCEGGCQTNYLTIEVVSDSVLEDITLSKLEITRHGKFGGDYLHAHVFTYAKDNVVYYWERDTSIVMYDFTKKVGETHNIFGWYDSKYTTCQQGFIGSVQIDSIGLENINGINANYYYTSKVDTSAWRYDEKISSIYGQKLAPIFRQQV